MRSKHQRDMYVNLRFNQIKYSTIKRLLKNKVFDFMFRCPCEMLIKRNVTTVKFLIAVLQP